jgi:N-acetylmuramoyl-L-alanine amidase CwlA
MYEITEDFIQGIPQNPYRNGVGSYEGVVAHCTASSNRSGGDTPYNEVAWEKRSWENAFVHFFVGVEDGEPVIRQSADTNYSAWGAGRFANERFVHVELCMYDDPDLFKIAYDAYVWLLAKVLYDKQLEVSSAGTLWGHFLVSDILGGTNHDDPLDYLAEHGITWDMFVTHVAEQYELMKPSVKERKPMEDWLKEAVKGAINSLAEKGRINSPKLWIGKLEDGQDISALPILLINNMIDEKGRVKA